MLVPPGRLRILLVALLLSAGRPVTIEALAERLWPEGEPDSVRGTVHTYVTRLRRLLGRDLIQTAAARGGYRLDVPLDDLDLHRFRELLRRSRDGAGHDEELRLLRAALALWRGRPFTGVESVWLDREIIPRLDEEWFAATERRIDLELDAGPPDRLVAELRGLADGHPTRESLWHRLIVALHRSGRRAEALDAYTRIRTTLREGFGIDPCAELQHLHRSILQEPAATPAAKGPRPRQLPHGIARFSGRKAELAELDRLCGTDQSPTAIVALDGAPGTGKTTLAVHWAHRIAGRYPDAQLYLNLNGYGPGQPVTPAAALATLLRGLWVAGDLIPPGVEERAALLRTTLADRRVLLVLDNARDADQVRALLPGSGGLVIVTSRSQLRGLSIRDGAHRVTLHRLSAGESAGLLSAAIPADRLAAEPGAAARLIELCAGLPLALAIVAERAHRAGSLAEVVHALQDEKARLDNFGAGEGDPHTDLRAALSWSYQALGPDAAAMLDRLGRHPAGTIGLESAAALADRPPAEAKRALDQLVAAHMVQQPRPDRYELHDLIRLYAAERPGDEAATTRLLEWYLHTAVSADTTLMPNRLRDFLVPYTPRTAPRTFADQAAAMAWFEEEYDGLRAVVAWAAAHGRPGYAWRIAIAMTTFLDRRIPWRDGVEFLEAAVRAAELAEERAGVGYTRNSLGCILLDRRDFARAEDCFARALVRFRSMGNRYGEAMALGNLGLARISVGDPAYGRELCRAAQEMCERDGYRRGVALNLDNLGMANVALGEHDRAVECHRRAAELFHELGETEIGAWNEQNLGRAYAAAGRYAESVRSLRLAAATLRRLGHRRQEANLLVDLGDTLLAAGHPKMARGCWRTALEAMRELSDPRVPALEAAIAGV